MSDCEKCTAEASAALKPEAAESFDDFCERLFWEHDNESKNASSSRMLFKEYLAKVANFNAEPSPIPPRPESKEPEYEYVKKEFDEQWEAARFQCDEGGLYFGDEATGFKKVTYQHQAAHLVDSLYTRKEIKRDWRDVVVLFDGVDKCELTENLIIDESFNEVGAVKLAKAILKAAGEGL